MLSQSSDCTSLQAWMLLFKNIHLLCWTNYSKTATKLTSSWLPVCMQVAEYDSITWSHVLYRVSSHETPIIRIWRVNAKEGGVYTKVLTAHTCISCSYVCSIHSTVRICPVLSPTVHIWGQPIKCIPQSNVYVEIFAGFYFAKLWKGWLCEKFAVLIFETT